MAGEPGDRWLRPRNGGVKPPLQGRSGRKVRTPSWGTLAVCGHRKACAEWSTELRTWATRLVTPGELESAPAWEGCRYKGSRKVPQRIDRRRSGARWHRTGKPARRLRKASSVRQGWKGGV